MNIYEAKDYISYQKDMNNNILSKYTIPALHDVYQYKINKYPNIYLIIDKAFGSLSKYIIDRYIPNFIINNYGNNYLKIYDLLKVCDNEAYKNINEITSMLDNRIKKFISEDIPNDVTYEKIIDMTDELNNNIQKDFVLIRNQIFYLNHIFFTKYNKYQATINMIIIW